MQAFQNLRVWRDAHALTLAVYRATASFPKEERYGLTSQVRRSASSVAANLAEGTGRGSDADFARFVQIAAASAAETRYHLILAADLRYLGAPHAARLGAQTDAVRRQLAGLLKTLRKSRAMPRRRPLAAR